MTTTTRSHQIEKNGQTVDRFRLVFIMDRQLDLNPDDYKLFMKNASEKLGIYDIVDKATLEVGRGFFGAKGEYWYADGEKLFEVADCIPSTEKEEERKRIVNSSSIGSTQGAERYFLEEAMVGSRSNTIIRYALFIKDEGFDYDDAEEKLFDFNDKLPEPLSKREIQGTILKTLKRNYNGNE